MSVRLLNDKHLWRYVDMLYFVSFTFYLWKDDHSYNYNYNIKVYYD